MEVEGGCYCGAVRYKAEGDALFKGQCHCRECQYGSGGAPNYVMALPEAGFSYTKGAAREFSRSDLDNPVTRPSLPGAVLIKVGTLDDPKEYGGPQMAIFTIDKQSFHHIPEGLPSFERTPG
ncbi:MAG: GFA family protein [Deltaproteobacteria bacterium]|nr:GFA family protein [Deltaproteobacteria bacterium]